MYVCTSISYLRVRKLCMHVCVLVPKPSVMSLVSANPQSDRQIKEITDHCFLLQEWRLTNNHSKSKVCNSVWGLNGSWGTYNHLKTKDSYPSFVFFFLKQVLFAYCGSIRMMLWCNPNPITSLQRSVWCCITLKAHWGCARYRHEVYLLEHNLWNHLVSWRLCSIRRKRRQNHLK